MRTSKPPSIINNLGDYIPERLDRAERRSRRPDDFKPPDPPPVGKAATLHWLNFIKADDWWQSQMPVALAALDAVIGLRVLSDALNPNRAGTADLPLKRVGRLIPDIEHRRLVFPDTTPTGIKGNSTPKFLWLQPPPRSPNIPGLALENAWSLWARCGRCGFNQFLPVAIDGRQYACCYHCTPPSQHRSIGATLVKKSLIHEALKKYY